MVFTGSHWYFQLSQAVTSQGAMVYVSRDDVATAIAVVKSLEQDVEAMRLLIKMLIKELSGKS